MIPFNKSQKRALTWMRDRDASAIFMRCKPLPDWRTLLTMFDYDPLTGVIRNRAPRKKIRVGEISGSRTANGYREIGIGRHRYLAHRIAWAMVHGDIPRTAQIDHINGKRDDNRIENLRLVEQSHNSRNSALSQLNTSGVPGVSWDKQRNMWRARIKVNGREIGLRHWHAFDNAVRARKIAESTYGFSESHGRPLCYPK